MTVAIFQFGSSTSSSTSTTTTSTSQQNDFKFSFNIAPLVGSTTAPLPKNCFQFNTTTFPTTNTNSCSKPPSQNVFQFSSSQQQQKQHNCDKKPSTGLFQLKPFVDTSSSNTNSNYSPNKKADKFYTADQNKENIDPKTMQSSLFNQQQQQQVTGVKEGKTVTNNKRYHRFGYGGPLVDITNAYQNSSNANNNQPRFKTVQSTFVGLGWGGEAWAENQEEQQYLARRKHRRMSEVEKEDKPVVFLDQYKTSYSYSSTTSSSSVFNTQKPQAQPQQPSMIPVLKKTQPKPQQRSIAKMR